LTVLTAALFLASEKVTCMKVGQAAVAFVGVLLVTIGAPEKPLNATDSSGP